ncbi:MAG: hypothetical protein FWC64_09200 [Treponema sp.]|nr:hypothetical protein [Treponema sp.]
MEKIRFICFVALCALFALASCTRGATGVQTTESPGNGSPAETHDSNEAWERVLSGSLYPQEVTFTVVAANVNLRGSGDWEGYHRIVERDILEVNSITGVQYTEILTNRTGGRSQAEEEALFSLENLFGAVFADWEEDAVYRLAFREGNASYMVYTTVVHPFSFIRFFRIFTRTDAGVQAIEGDIPVQIESPESGLLAETSSSNEAWERVLSGSLHPQEVTITVVAENASIWGSGRREGYHRIVERDILEVNNRSGAQYTEILANRTWSRSQAEWEAFSSLRDLFEANFSDWGENSVYRLAFREGNTSYMVYTAFAPPFSLMAFFRIFTRIIE